MLLLNSRLSPPSPHVLLQVVQDRLFETAATAKVMLLLVVLLLQLLLLHTTTSTSHVLFHVVHHRPFKTATAAH